MKPILIAAALAVASPALSNERVKDVRVFHHTKNIKLSVPVTKVRCVDVKEPIYQDVQTQGNAAGGALAGMIIGGILGKGVSGNDDGAAAGAVIGGLIGANEGAQPTTERRIVGYEYVERCKEVTYNQQEYVDAYSHSTIRFYLDGKRYVLNFER